MHTTNATAPSETREGGAVFVGQIYNMKTPQILIDAQNQWPEDEAGMTADSYKLYIENGYTAEELAASHNKNVAHMYRVFSHEQDGPELIRAYNAQLVRLGVPVPAPFA